MKQSVYELPDAHYMGYWLIGSDREILAFLFAQYFSPRGVLDMLTRFFKKACFCSICLAQDEKTLKLEYFAGY